MAKPTGRTKWGSKLSDNIVLNNTHEESNLATDLAMQIEMLDETTEESIQKENKKETSTTETEAIVEKNESKKKEPKTKKKQKKSTSRENQTLRNFYLNEDIYNYIEKFLPLYDNNFSKYIRKLIVDDINTNYKAYMEKMKTYKQNNEIGITVDINEY